MPVLGVYPRFRATDDDGNPLAGGKLYTYAQGTSTPKATYTDFTALTANANPVILDAAGEADVWLVGNYKFVLYSSADVLQWTVDGIPGSDGTTRLETAVAASAGAGTVVAANAIPANARVHNVFLEIGTTFGNSNGLTGISIGDGTIDERWGKGIARTASTATDQGDMRDGGLPIYSAASDVYLTAEGGNFDATGAGTITVIYSIATP